MLRIRRFEARDLPEVVAVLADAFSSHPLREHMLPGPRRRKLAIGVGDTALFLEGVRYGRALVATWGDTIAGMLSWIEPQHHPRPRWRALALDVSRIPFLFCPPHGFSGFKFQPALDAFHRNEPSLYFTIAATRTSLQRRGVASALLDAMTKRADELGCSVFLETSNHRNLNLYGRHGFQVVDRARPLPSGPEVVAMLRPAAATPA